LNRSKWPTWLGLGLLGLSLTGNPGVTGPVPAGPLLLGGVLAALASLLLWQRGPAALPTFAWLLLPLTALAALSLNGALCLFLAQISFASLVGFVGLFLVFALAPSDAKDFQQTQFFLLMLLLASQIHGFSIFLQNQEALRGTFTNPDCYSVLCLLAVFTSLGLFLHCQGWIRAATAVASIFSLACLLLTGSRAGLVGLGAGYLAMLFTLTSSRSSLYRSYAVRLTLVPAVLVLVLVVAGSSLQLGEKWARLGLGQDVVAYKNRLDVLRVGYKTVLRYPLLGAGPGCFHLAYQQDRPPLMAGEDYMNIAHNDYAQWLVECGIPGGLLGLAFGLGAIATLWRSYRAPTPWVATSLGALLAVATYMALNPAFPVSALFFWMGAYLGMAASLWRLQRPRNGLAWSPKLFPFCLALAISGLWAADFGRRCWSAQRTQTQAAKLQRLLDWEGALLILQASQKFTPGDPKLHLETATLARKAYVASPKATWLETEEQALQRARQSSPHDLKVLLQSAEALEERGRVAEAATFVQQASQLAPSSPHVRRAQARNLIFAGRVEEAAQKLADVKKVGLVVDDGTLAMLTYWLESKKVGQGRSQLKNLEGERLRAVGLQATQAAFARKDAATAERLLKELSLRLPDDPKVAFDWAKAQGMAGNLDTELKMIERVRRNPRVEDDEALLNQIWQRWSEIRLAKKEADIVMAQLEDFLINHPQSHWARLTLARVHGQAGRGAEARAALRAGLPYDRDGQLHVALGDLCAAQGLTTIARSYFQEAQALGVDRKLLNERLAALAKVPVEDSLDALPAEESEGNSRR